MARAKLSRGPRKEGKILINLRLTPEEVAALDAIAERELRSRTQQIRRFLQEAIRCDARVIRAIGGTNE